MQSTPRLFLHSCAVFFTSAMIASANGASSVPSYTVTDLGVIPYPVGGLDVTFSNTGANGTFTTPSGAVYAFPRTDNLVVNPQSLLDTFPPFTNAPIHASTTYGNPNNAYSYFDTYGVFLNKAGDFAATDILGVNGHPNPGGLYGSIVYTATRQANGTFGPLSTLWSSPNNYNSGGQVAKVLDLNNAGQLLGVNAGQTLSSYIGERDYFLYNLKTGVRTDLASLLPTGWYPDIPSMALDDQGRILLTAFSGAYDPDHLLLLTPAGLSSNPIPAPEPTTFVMFAVAGLGLAIRRRWKS